MPAQGKATQMSLSPWAACLCGEEALIASG